MKDLFITDKEGVAITKENNPRMYGIVENEYKSSLSYLTNVAEQKNRLVKLLESGGFKLGKDVFFCFGNGDTSSRYLEVKEGYSDLEVIDYEDNTRHQLICHNFPILDSRFTNTPYVVIKSAVIRRDDFGNHYADKDLSRVVFACDSRGRADYSKVVSYWLLDHERAVLPSTLKKKLDEKVERVLMDVSHKNILESVTKYTINKYKQMYPKASITTCGLYGTKGRYFGEGVKIDFGNGSSVELKVSSERDQEYVHKYYDAKVKELDFGSLLNYLSK